MSIRPGQVFTTDLVVSAFVFVAIINLAFLSWSEANTGQYDRLQDRAMQQSGFYATSLLVRTAGHPTDWTATDVEILGVSKPDHVLQETRLRELDALSYSDLKIAMDLTGYEVGLNISTDGAPATIIGDSPGESDMPLQWGQHPVDADDITVQRRAVIVNASNMYERATLEVVVWR